jgi:hypothetical protein
MSLYKKWQGRLAEIRGSAFSFFSDDEIRRMSVKRIENPISYDNMRNPTEGGLYDPVLGCWQRGETYAWTSKFSDFFVFRVEDFLTPAPCVLRPRKMQNL